MRTLTQSFKASWRQLRLAWQVRHERHMLTKLDADQLVDIGKTQHEANMEAKRGFDVPAKRLKGEAD